MYWLHILGDKPDEWHQFTSEANIDKYLLRLDENADVNVLIKKGDWLISRWIFSAYINNIWWKIKNILFKLKAIG